MTSQGTIPERKGGFENFPKIKKEIDTNISMLMVFETILDSLVIVAALYLVFVLLTIPAIYSVIPAALYFVIVLAARQKRNKLVMVESRYNELNEKLRTANDNLGMRNEIVENLDREIASQARGVELAAFFGTRRTAVKLAMLVSICFLIIFLSSLNTKFIDIRLFVENVVKPKPAENGVLGEIAKQKTPIGKDVVMSPTSSAEIYGDSGMAPGNTTRQMKVDPIGYEVNIRKEGESYEAEFEERFPQEVFAQSSAVFEDRIPVEKQELVKKYFKQIAK